MHNTRSIFALALIAMIGTGSAFAASVYSTSACGPVCQPVVQTVACDPCGQPATVSYAPQGTMVQTTAYVQNSFTSAGVINAMPEGTRVVGAVRTNLPGFYSDDYDYTVSSQRNLGFDYLTPTRNGFVETSTIPLTNPVDRYYGTHEEIGGRVIDLTDPANRSIEDQNVRDYVADPANRIPARPNYVR